MYSRSRYVTRARADDGGKQAKKEKLEIIPSHLDIMDVQGQRPGRKES